MNGGNSGRISNFRTNFVGRVVNDLAESNRFQLEEQILSDDADVDLTKLAQYVLKYHLPSAHRVAVWKLLLGNLFSFTFIAIIIFINTMKNSFCS